MPFLVHLVSFWHHVCFKIMFFVSLTAAKHHLGTLLVILNKCSIKITFSVPFSAEHLQNTDDTSDEGAFPLEGFLSHLARSGTCRRHLDPLRARRRLRRVWICVVMLSACTLFACLPSAFFLSFFVCIYALSLFRSC